MTDDVKLKDHLLDEIHDIMYMEKYYPDFALVKESFPYVEEDKLRQEYEGLQDEIDALYYEEPHRTGAIKHI